MHSEIIVHSNELGFPIAKFGSDNKGIYLMTLCKMFYIDYALITNFVHF